MMKRKLWFNVTPGKDLVADLMFHFPQVLKNTGSSNRQASHFFLTDVFFIFHFCIGHAFQTGIVQVPAWLPQLHQTGHDGPGRAALQSSGGFRQDAVRRGPQTTGRPGPCRPNQNHDDSRLEDGKRKTKTR